MNYQSITKYSYNLNVARMVHSKFKAAKRQYFILTRTVMFLFQIKKEINIDKYFEHYFN